jgi:hypothetical protein
MNAMQRPEIRFPVGRIVGGSISQEKTTDYEGKPLVYKSGDKIGQPRVEFGFGIAFPKTQAHWGNEPGWGQTIWNFGNTTWGAVAQNKDFSWKITDGDSTEPNRKGNKPCDAEGYPGHWVVWFSGSTRPKVCDAKGERFLSEEEIVAIKAGYFVQVFGDIDSNKSTGNPGLYINHKIVAFSGYGPEIQLGVDLKSVGFGSDPLPAGASAAPVGMTAAPGVAGAPGVATPAPPVAAPPVATPPVATPTPTAVQPHAAILNAGAVTPPPPPVAAPPAPAAGPQMNPSAGGVSYQAFKDAGWSDEQLRAAGHIN